MTDCYKHSIVNEYWQETVKKILTWEKCVQKWYWNSCLMDRNKEELKFTKTLWREKIIFWAVSSQMFCSSICITMKEATKCTMEDWRTTKSADPEVHHSDQELKQFWWVFDIKECLIKLCQSKTMSFYQLGTKWIIPTMWKWWKGCMVKIDKNGPTFCQQLIDLA